MLGLWDFLAIIIIAGIIGKIIDTYIKTRGKRKR